MLLNSFPKRFSKTLFQSFTHTISYTLRISHFSTTLWSFHPSYSRLVMTRLSDISMYLSLFLSCLTCSLVESIVQSLSFPACLTSLSMIPSKSTHVAAGGNTFQWVRRTPYACTPYMCTPYACTPYTCTPYVCTPRVCTPRVCTPHAYTPYACTPRVCTPCVCTIPFLSLPLLMGGHGLLACPGCCK